MTKKTAYIIIYTVIFVIWIGYAFSLVAKSNAPVSHIIAIPLSYGVFPFVALLTVILLLAQCAVIFSRHRILFTLLLLGFTLFLMNMFFPSLYLSLQIQNTTKHQITVQSINIVSDAVLSRRIEPHKAGYIVLAEGDSKELLSDEVFILTAYTPQGDILYSNRMTGKEIFDLERLTIDGHYETREQKSNTDMNLSSSSKNQQRE